MTLFLWESWLKNRHHYRYKCVRGTVLKIYWGSLEECIFPFVSVSFCSQRRQKIRSSRLLRKVTRITGTQKITYDALATKNWLKKMVKLHLPFCYTCFPPYSVPSEADL